MNNVTEEDSLQSLLGLNSPPMNSKRSRQLWEDERLFQSASTFGTSSPIAEKHVHLNGSNSFMSNFIQKLDNVPFEEEIFDDENLLDMQDIPNTNLHYSDVLPLENLDESSQYSPIFLNNINLDQNTTQSLFVLHHLTQRKVPALLAGTQFACLKIFGREAPLLKWLMLLSPQPFSQLDNYMEAVKGKPGSAIFAQNMMWSHLIRLKITGAEPEHLEQDLSSFIDELSTMDHTFSTEEERLCLELNGCSITKINALEQMSSSQIKKLFPPAYIIAMSRNDKRLSSNGVTYNLAWNTDEPLCYNKQPCTVPDKLKNDRRSVPAVYGVPYDGNYKDLMNIPCMAQSDLTSLREIYTKKCLVRYLLKKGLSKEDILALNINIEFLSSAHPFFYIQEVLLGNVPCQTISIESMMGKEYLQNRTQDILDQNGEHAEVSIVLRHLTMVLIAYSDRWRSKRERIINFYNHNHNSKAERRESLKIDLSTIPELQRNCKDLETLERNMLDPLLKLLYNKEIKTQEAMEFLCEKAMKADSNLSCSKLPLIAEKLEKAKATFDRYSPQTGMVRRRQKLADFVTHRKLFGEDVSDLIEKVEGMGEFDQMVKACQDYLLMTLGYDFCNHMMKIVLQYDENTSTSKVRGIFLRGGTSAGKSQALKVILRMFENRYILNDKRTTENPGEVALDGIIKCRCDFLVLDEFECKKFSKAETMKQSSFNNLFDLSKDSIFVDVKHKLLMILNKPIPILASHYEVDSFLKTYDDSFFSRFGPKIDMDELIELKDKKEWPERKGHEESVEAYKDRIVKGGYADYKPVFPLTVEDGEFIDEDLEKKRSKALLEKYGLPERSQNSEAVEKMTSRANTHRNLLLRNRLTQHCAKFPILKIDQAAYVFWTALIKIWDDIWALKTDSEKETIFPLQSCRSTKKENVVVDGLKYSHGDFSEQQLCPSVIMSYPEDLETPQRLVKKLVLQNV